MAAPVIPHSPHGGVEIDRALTAIILAGGNAEKAAKQSGFNARTLRHWRDKHADRYQELQRELAPRIAEQIASEAEELAVMYAEAERQALRVALSKIDQLDSDKAAGAVRNFATAKALQVDKISSPLRGRPTAITEHRASQDLLRGLAARVGMTLDHQEEPEDAEIVESSEKPLLPERADAKARDPESTA